MTAAFAAALLAWYDTNRRDLPWRHTRDPWAIWVSEIMLQQTRVEAVRDAFTRFVVAFPTPAAWAAADDDVLLRAWRGLGYYRRARLLRDGARAVVAQHGGCVPRDPAQLGALPGIGEYTRGAIASIAFAQRLAAIDGNVERVAARQAGIAHSVKSGAGRRAVEQWVTARLAAAPRPGDFNQALMELGATICTPRAPRCDDCPVARPCVARRTGATARLPLLPPRRVATPVTARAIWLPATDGLVWAQRLPAGAINAGQWELPGPGMLADTAPGDLQRWLAAQQRGRWQVGATLTEIRHTITHHRIRLHVHAASGPRRLPAHWAAHAPDDPAVAWTTATRKAFGSGLAGTVRRPLSSPARSFPD